MKRYIMALLFSVSLGASTVSANHINWMEEGITPVGNTKMESYYMPHFSSEMLLVSQEIGGDLFYGYVNYTGNYSIAPTFSEAKPFSEGLAPAKGLNANGQERYGFINTMGNFVIQPTYLDAYGFSEGLAAVEITAGSWAYVDRSGTLAMSDRYSWAHDFHDGYAVVEQNGAYGLIDTKGEVVLDFAFNSIGQGDLLYPVREDRLYGLMDVSGTLVQSYQYDNMGMYQEELALVEQNGKWGYLDNTGAMVIEPSLDQAFHFVDGLAWVRNNNMSYYIDSSGRTQLTMYGMDEVTSFSQGYARGKQGHFYGFFDKTGATVVPFIYRDAVPVSGGVGLVYDGTNWGMFFPSHKASDWAGSYLDQAKKQQLFPASFEGVDLTAPVSRSQFAALVVTIYDMFIEELNSEYKVLAEGVDPFAVPSLVENPFTDTRDVYVRRAYDLKLTTGVSDTVYGVYDNLTREQAATMLLTLYKALRGEVLEPQGAPNFEDHSEISEWARDSVYILAEKGILTGVGDNFFAPQATLSGESALVMALAFCTELGYR